MEHSNQSNSNEFNPLNSLEYLSNPINPDFTFDSFVIGEFNHFAKFCAMSLVTKTNISIYNPLVIYGEVGLGKTHLAQAIYHKRLNENPNEITIYVGCEAFCRQYLYAIRNNNTDNFLNFYCKSDTLIVDDLQYLKGNQATQEALIVIYENLLQSGKQLIFTTSILPNDFLEFDNRLLSRLKYGLTVCIQKPTYHTRLEIIKQIIKRLDFKIPEEVQKYLAQKVDTSIRELQSLLIILLAKATFSITEIDIELAKATIDEVYKKWHEI